MAMIDLDEVERWVDGESWCPGEERHMRALIRELRAARKVVEAMRDTKPVDETQGGPHRRNWSKAMFEAEAAYAAYDSAKGGAGGDGDG